MNLRSRQISQLVLVVVAGVMVFAALSQLRSDAQITRLRHEGERVTAEVTRCTGTLGGSGSTSAGYNCVVSFSVHGRQFQAELQQILAVDAVGHSLAVVVDPKNRQSANTADAVRMLRAPIGRQVAIFTVLLSGWSWLLWRTRRPRE